MMTSYDNFKQATLTAVVAAALSLGLSLPASASLIGDTITISSQANFPVDTWIDTVVVGAGIELQGVEDPAFGPPYSDNGSLFQHTNSILATGSGVGGGAIFPHLFAGDYYDIGANSITIHYEALGPIFGFSYAFITDFSDLNWTDMPGTLTNVTIESGAMGLLGSNINPNMITASSFQFQGTVDLVNGAHFTLNLTAVHDQPPTPATEMTWPSPATSFLLLSGLVMGVLTCRKRALREMRRSSRL